MALSAGASGTGNFEVKDVSVFLTLATAVSSLLTVVRARTRWFHEKKRLGKLGKVAWCTDYIPNVALAFMTFIISIAGIIYFFGRTVPYTASTPVLSAAVAFTLDYWYVIFLAWLTTGVLGWFNVIPKGLLTICGKISAFRQTIGFANASWHVRLEDRANAVALADSTRSLAQKVVDGLAAAGSPGNPDRALRPPGLEDDEAANVLYFRPRSRRRP